MNPVLLTLYGDYELMGDARHTAAKITKGIIGKIPGIGVIAQAIPERVFTIPKRATILPAKTKAAISRAATSAITKAIPKIAPIISPAPPSVSVAPRASIFTPQNIAIGAGLLFIIGGAVYFTRKRGAR